MSNIIEKKIQNAIFHTVGTNADSYFNRLKNKYPINSEFKIQTFDNKNYQIISNEKKIDEFTSSATKNQFINTLIAFGLLKEKIGSYKTIHNFDISYQLENIFKNTSNKDIQIIKQSRMLSLLSLLNIINKENFKELNIFGKKGLAKIRNIKNEASIWEKEVVNNQKPLMEFLERLNKYEFIKK